MKLLRRIMFSALIAGVFCMFVAILIRHSNPDLSKNLQPIASLSLLGLQIWSIIFLKSEPTLARIGLTLIILTVMAVYAFAL